jgi:DMSO/TMAO reductase YedYZ molybdopterin-dependent catalytic subunit
VSDHRPAAIPRWAAPLAGVVAVAAALAAGELVAGTVRGAPSPILSIGRLLIDLQPAGAKDVAVALFGTNDKAALEVAVALVALAIGAALGRLAVHRHGEAALVIGAFAALGFVAALRDPEVQPVFAAGAAGIEWLVGIAALGRLVPQPPGPIHAITAEGAPVASMPDWSRRAFLRTAGAVGAAAVAATVAGRLLLAKTRTAVVSAGLPKAGKVATLPPGADLGVDGLTPIVVPNGDFYRIDTALVAPSVDRATWSLRVHGMVDRETTLTWDELVALPIVEQYVTIACVSNSVGGDLVGNAKWTGIPLRTVLDMAGVQATATQLVGRSVDGFTAGAPVAWVMDPVREPLIAIGMNDAPLPQEHGYPARLIIPGLYGYVSATKWLKEIELTTFAAFSAYWVPLGWAAEAPILTQSRIDRPRDGASFPAGTYAVAGVAWAPDRGVRKVEVQVDAGDWQAATISAPISDATWVQWRYDWVATPGSHTISVRATDGTGDVQTADRSAPAPDGARGHHAILVTVNG